jgi:hypothetical protein
MTVELPREPIHSPFGAAQREEPSMNVRQNRHPADLLADTRAEIKALQKRENDLRRQLVESGDFTGAEWKAQIVNRTQERLDCGAVIKHFGKTVLQPFLKTLKFDQIYLKRRKQARLADLQTQLKQADE